MSENLADAIDVLIVGGGPVGLTTACELARYGVSFRCVDKRAAPVTHSHASVVHVRTQEVFHAMGCSEGFVKEGFLYAQQAFYAFGKRLGQMNLNGVDSPFDGPRDIWQSATERLLIEHLARFGRHVERPVEATSYHEEDDHAVVSLKHEDGTVERVRAKWVVSAEGSHSIVREALGIAFEGPRYENQEFVQTDAHVKWSFPNGVGHAFIDHDRFVGFFPFDDKGFYRVLCARPTVGEVRHDPPTLDEMQQIVRESVDPDAELSNPAWLNRFHAQRRKAERFHKGRAFLAGDSGHVHVPVGGQGMNTGIQDAFNLSWKLAYVLRGQAKLELLETYDEERSPVAERLLKFTDSGFHTLARPDAFQSFLIGTFGGFLLSSPTVRGQIRESLEEVGINYRGSRLAAPEHGALRSGDRAPTTTTVRGDDFQLVALLDLLRGTHWTILAFAADTDGAVLISQYRQLTSGLDHLVKFRLILKDRPKSGWPAEVSFAIDRGGGLHDRYHAAVPRLVLIRPDWYIAKIVDGFQASDLAGYLRQWLAPAKM